MITRLVETLPEWATVVSQKGKLLRIVAAPTQPSGMQCEPIELTILEDAGEIEISETQVGLKLPQACPERHINSNGTFCIGLNAGKSIDSRSKTERWWKYLATYLGCQEFAAKKGRWPPGKQLSHGSAAKFQLRAEEFAQTLGLAQEYQDAVEQRTGWLAGYLPKCSKTEKRLLNGRARCPKGCKTKIGAPLLRRQCKRPEQIWGLISNETMRRAEEKRFIQGYQRDGMRCCGTMENCPFRH